MCHPSPSKCGSLAAGLVLALLASPSHAALGDPCPLATLPAYQSPHLFAGQAKRHAELTAEGRSLDADIKKFNATYASVPENSPLVAQAAKEQAGLEVRRTRFCAAVAQLNARLVSARQTDGRLQELHARLQNAQRALAALGRGADANSTEVANWADVTASAVENAEELVPELMIEAFVGLTAEAVRSGFGAMRGEIADQLKAAAEKLANVPGPEQAKWRELFGMLQQQMTNVTRLETLAPMAVEGMTAVHTGTERLAPELRRLLESTANIEAAMVGLGLAASATGQASYLGLGRLNLEAAYNLTAISLAWARIDQGNRNAERNLAAVNTLSSLVKRLVGQIAEAKQAAAK